MTEPLNMFVCTLMVSASRIQVLPSRAGVEIERVDNIRRSEASMFNYIWMYSVLCTHLQVDLWSVGATFFHAATGRLPFQPYRKRDDRALM